MFVERFCNSIFNSKWYLDLLSMRIYTAYIRHRYVIGEIQKIVAAKPTDIFNRYVVGQVYIFEK